MPNISKFILGPRLYRIYPITGANTEGEIYTPNVLEALSNNIVKGINIMQNVGLYASPLIIMYMYRKDCFCVTGCISMFKLATGISILLVAAMIFRGIGRTTNQTYSRFLSTLIKAQQQPNFENKEAMRLYDFDLSAWPEDFSYIDYERDHQKSRIQVDRFMSKTQVGSVKWILGIPCNIVAWSLMHLFGRHLIYPGSTQLLQAILAPMLEAGREKLVVTHGGKRNKLHVRDGNFIDTMFVDRRNNKLYHNGSTLVVCCEGNAGSYEVGLMNTAIEGEYSVLGWNHPGFTGSTGTPFPSQEQNAIDGVMQFAIHKLGFNVENIIVYGWSIGGYTASWAAMNYPGIKGLVLDASFDDLLPLALSKMSGWMSGLIRRAIRQHMNLNVADQVCQYHGPLTIIRRTEDEIITVKEGDISTNRGNYLLLNVLRARYPNLFLSSVAVHTFNKWISELPPRNEAVYRSAEVDDEFCWGQLVSYVDQNSLSYPLLIGEDWSEEDRMKMLLYLAKKYLVNVKMGHNNPLESQYLRIQWAPFYDPSYVQLD